MKVRMEVGTLARTADISRRRVVVADDNPGCLNQICSLIEKNFEIVARAVDGLECVEAVRKYSPSVVITDISMPKMNGIEATRVIAKIAPDVRVVILSGHDDPAFVEAAIDAGASAYVVKLSAFQDLIPAIEEVAAGRSYLPAFG
jgi:two-component system nitrate/nitrite response regulator NarL